MDQLAGQQRAELADRDKQLLECLPADAGAAAHEQAPEGMSGPSNSAHRTRSTDGGRSQAAKRQRHR